MNSEKTLSEWNDFVFEMTGQSHMDRAKQLADFLGVELAPERPALPGWAEEGLGIEAGGVVVDRRGRSVALGRLHEFSRKKEAIANRRALVEVHRRWLAAKQRIEAVPGSPGCFVEGAYAWDVYHILRGQDRA